MNVEQISRRLFEPILAGATLRDRIIGCLGAMLGVGLTGLLGWLSLGRDQALPFLVAPMGASALLLFVVPASPMAQPWPIVGGNALGALCGVAAVTLVSDPILASAVAVALAIAVMSLTRSLHPPGGAAALVAVLGGPSVVAAGYQFALFPVAANSAALVAFGWLFHRLTGHRYPHVQAAPSEAKAPADAVPRARISFDMQDIDDVLSEHGETFDISREDLDELLRKIELRALSRRSGSASMA